MSKKRFLVLFAASLAAFFKTQESGFASFLEKMNTLVWPFYEQNATEFRITRPQGIEIQVVHFENPKALGHVFFLTGVNDTYMRNLETLYDIYQQGYTVTSYDHRSQGHSSRLTINPQMVHNSNFDNYSDDLDAVVDFFRVSRFSATFDSAQSPSKELPRLAVSASLGGAILARFVMKNPDVFLATVYAVPMFGFKTEPYSNWVALNLASTLCALGQCKAYAPGQTDFTGFGQFEDQTSTHSRERFIFKNDLFTNNPELLVAGKSNGWVREALKVTRKIKGFHKWTTRPTLVLSAENEDTVINDSHTQVCNSMPNCQQKIVSNSFHDVFNEDDTYRDQVMNDLFSFFAQALRFKQPQRQ